MTLGRSSKTTAATDDGAATGIDGGPPRTDARARSAAVLAAVRAIAVAALITALAGLIFALVRQPSIHRWPSLVIYGAAWSVFAAALWLVRRVPMRTAVALILVGGAAVGLAAASAPPSSSDDLYRYVWDGRVQAAGIDPYAYVPSAPQLAGLRDSFLWPAQGTYCVAAGLANPDAPGDLQPGCTLINRPTVHTIYPPVAEAYFRAVHEASPAGSRYKPIQLAAVLLGEAVTLALLIGLRRLGRDPRQAAIWAWCPLVAYETGNGAHVDVLGVLLAVGALIVLAATAAAGRRAARWGGAAAGVLLGLAIGAKFTPAFAVPAALRRRTLTVAGGAAVTFVLIYVPHVIAVGSKVIGFIPGYLNEQGYRSGTGYVLLGAVLPTSWAPVAAVAIVAAAGALVYARADPAEPWRGAVVLTGVALLVTTPQFPWYAMLLCAFVALDGRREWLAIPAAGLAAQHVGYALAAVVVVAGWWLRQRAARRDGRSAAPVTHAAWPTIDEADGSGGSRAVPVLVDVILPCLDEAGALPSVLARMPAGYRPIVVDNGSTDGSAELAAQLGARVVSEPRRGFGAACHAGLLAATATSSASAIATALWTPLSCRWSPDRCCAARRTWSSADAGRRPAARGRRMPERPTSLSRSACAATGVGRARPRARCARRAGRRCWRWTWPTGARATRWRWCSRRPRPVADRGDRRRIRAAHRQVQGDRNRSADSRRGARHEPGLARGRAGGGAMSTVIVLAKAPVPGRVKTRLTPPFSPRQAADLAEAALRDTLTAASGSKADHLLVFLDGGAGPWLAAASQAAGSPAISVLAQPDGGLDRRIAAAMTAAASLDPGPALLIGMDTPQVTTALLDEGLDALTEGTGADAVLGLAQDGGFWALGLSAGCLVGDFPERLVHGVPMSTARTGAEQHARLVGARLRVVSLPELQDVDTAADAHAVAALVPGSAFARHLAGCLPDTDLLAGGGTGWSGPTASAYERALWAVLTGSAARAVTLHADDGSTVSLDIARYVGEPDGSDEVLLRRCTGPTLDIGCGPGRMAAALAGRGIPALGVDVVAAALLLARASGATVIRRSVFDRIPGEGAWSHALLTDGNIGIGGDPRALLERVRELLCPGGEVVVETSPDAVDDRLSLRAAPGSATIPWARVGTEALVEMALPLGFRVAELWHDAGRRFAALRSAPA